MDEIKKYLNELKEQKYSGCGKIFKTTYFLLRLIVLKLESMEPKPITKYITKPKMIRIPTWDMLGNCDIERLKWVKHIVEQGYSKECPHWTCDNCKLIFPRVVVNIENKCPCDVYEPDYLIARLNEIIRNFPTKPE